MAKVKTKNAKPKNARPNDCRHNDAKLENIAPLPETLAAADRLHSAAIHLLRRVRQQDVATGVGPAQLSSLSVLVFAGPKTFGELASAEQVKPPTMSRIVAGLKRSRLIKITRDPHDSRRMHIRPSAKGTHLLQQARRRRIESLASQLRILSPDELARLGEAVDVLKSLLDNWH
jgi:DNA-binding MarR family transcriptional regulator